MDKEVHVTNRPVCWLMPVPVHDRWESTSLGREGKGAGKEGKALLPRTCIRTLRGLIGQSCY